MSRRRNAAIVASLYLLRCNALLGKGMVLANRYRIEKLLGCGGFGAVYLATDLTFEQVRQERKVAVKENHDPSALNAFLKEAGLLANLHHPNLPRVSDFFTEQPPTIPQPRPYMVMDYIAGEELWERIQRQGKLSEQEVLDLLGGVFDALEYLHSQNPPIFHRDIKPQNIRITPEGRTFLVDFGIAKVGWRDDDNIVTSSDATFCTARAISDGWRNGRQK